MGFFSRRISPALGAGSGGSSNQFGTPPNYAEFLDDGTLKLHGDARTWDDIRVAAHELQAVGASSPEWKLFANDNSYTATDYSISVDGNSQYGTIPDYSSLDVSGNFSIEAWVQITDRHLIIADRPNYFRFEVYGKDLRFQIRTGSTFSIATSGNVIIPDKWTHVCATVSWDGSTSTVVLYVDGVEQKSDTTARELSGASSEAITIGRKASSTTRYGFIDELIAYNIVLTESQIAARYNNGTAHHVLPGTVTESTDVIFKFDFLEGSGTTVDNDSTLGNGQDMTLSTSIWSEGVVTGSIIGGVYLPAFSPDIINEVYFAIQFPHKTDLAAEIHPHIHWSQGDGNGGDVYWELEYTWANVGGDFEETTKIGSATEVTGNADYGVHCYTNFGVIPANLMAGVSPMMVCTVRRRVDKAEDTLDVEAFLLDIDFHVQIDSLGSSEEFVKWD